MSFMGSKDAALELCAGEASSRDGGRKRSIW
jgi:hypothetical protein